MRTRTTLAIVAFAIGASAQPQKLIEVASIKPSRNNTGDSNFDSVRGRLTATNITVRELVRFAYNSRDYQIGPAPKWIDNERFDIAAKSADDSSSSLDHERAVVRELLTGRFQLTTHREVRQMPVFLLVVAKDGPKLPAHDDAAPKLRGGCGRLVGRRVNADAIATILSRQLEHAVFNRTSLSGEYDFHLDFTPDSGPCRTPADIQTGSAPLDPSTLPSISAAVQQQLGLKLESSKGPVEVLIIDRIQRPSEN